MRRAIISIAVTLLLGTFGTPALFAQESSAKPVPPSSKQDQPPDYSPKTLLSIMHEHSDRDATRDPLDIGITFERGHFRFHWIPLMAPLIVSTAAGYRASVMPMPDPLTLTG